MTTFNPKYSAALKARTAAIKSQSPEKIRESAYDLNYRIRALNYSPNSMHNINFLFKEYKYGEGTEGFSTVGRTNASISLPLPANLVDSFSVQVGGFELGATGAMAANALSGGDVSGDVAGAFNNAVSNFKGSDGDTSAIATAVSGLQAASGFFARNALEALGFGGVAGGISVAGGDAINPHVALKFDGVNLKTHSFTWNLAPKNEAESDEIQNIISQFKKAMLPSYGLGGGGPVGRALLKYPDIVDIGFSGLDVPYYFQFKRCMINSFNVNYTPNGPGILRGGRPASVQIELQVTETEIHTKEDYI